MYCAVCMCSIFLSILLLSGVARRISSSVVTSALLFLCFNDCFDVVPAYFLVCRLYSHIHVIFNTSLRFLRVCHLGTNCLLSSFFYCFWFWISACQQRTLQLFPVLCTFLHTDNISASTDLCSHLLARFPFGHAFSLSLGDFICVHYNWDSCSGIVPYTIVWLWIVILLMLCFVRAYLSFQCIIHFSTVIYLYYLYFLRYCRCL